MTTVLNNSWDGFNSTMDINKLKFGQNSNIYTFNKEECEEIQILFSSQHQVKQYLHIPSSQKMAVKIIHHPRRYVDKQTEELELKMLKQEIEAHRSLLGSPYIVEFYGYCLQQNDILICMELMDLSLKDFYVVMHKVQTHFPGSLLGCIGVAVVQALKACKDRGIMHRDVKPSNILLNWDGSIKLCDFGVSRILFDDSTASTFVGTVPYLPPERMSHSKFNRYDIRTDIWSLGISLVELILGYMPFRTSDSADTFDIVAKIKNTPVEKILDLIKNVMLSTREFIEICLRPYETRATIEELMETDFFCTYSKFQTNEIQKYMEAIKKTTLIHPLQDHNYDIETHSSNNDTMEITTSGIVLKEKRSDTENETLAPAITENLSVAQGSPSDHSVTEKLEWIQKQGAKYPSMAIMDAIHGNIPVFYPINKLIDTPEFQRLRKIKQLGGCYLVFPSADHSRFCHCLGVYHLARAHVNALAERQPELGINSSDKLCVCIAALLHDLGHGPLSHTFEIFMKQANPEARWKHEECSTKIFRYMLAHNQELKNILNKYLNEIDYVFIAEMINPPKEFIINGEWQLQGRDKNKSFLYDIVSNKHDCIDVDKFDYLMRDSKSTKINIPFCKTALGRIQIYMEARDFDFGYSRIVYGRKIRDNINGVMFSREDLHTKLYQHKTVVACETMIVDAWLKATPYFKVLTEQGEYDLVHAIENIEAFLQLNDLLLEQILQSKDPYLKESQAILQKVENRHTLRLIGQTFLFSNCKKTTTEIKNEILKLDNTIHPNSVIVVIREIHRGKSIEDDPITEVRIFNEANPTDNETNQLSYYWKETNIASKTGKRNVYVYVPYETSLIEKEKIFVAFEKLCRKINCCELPVKRQRLSTNSSFIPNIM